MQLTPGQSSTIQEIFFQDFKQYIPSFCSLLDRVNAANISTTAYVQEYLQHLLQHRRYYLQIYTAVLDKAFSKLNSSSASLLDFGTGNGMLALFAKYCGVKHVYASDINYGFVSAAQQLSSQLNIQIDGWITGSENELPGYFENGAPDVVVGTDVIEHVYDLDNLFSIFGKLNPNIITVLTTSACAENPFKSAELKKIQTKDELVAGNLFHAAHDNEYAGLSFLETRKKMIRALHLNLSEKTIDELASKTRGLKKDDIEKAAVYFLQTGNMPEVLKHPTNTCDPVTGSWIERLLTVKEYAAIYNSHGFTLKVYNGFYNQYGNSFKAFASGFINKLLLLFPEKTIALSPFIILKAAKTNAVA